MKSKDWLAVVGLVFVGSVLKLSGQEPLVEPTVLPGPSSLTRGGQSGSITLTRESSRANKITDEEQWWTRNDLTKPVVYQRFPGIAKGTIPPGAPDSYLDRKLVAAWTTANGKFYAYGESIYRSVYLLVESLEGEITHLFDARKYGNVAWADMVDGMLYLTNNPGNFSAADGGGARIFAIDLQSNLLKWASPEKICKGQFAVIAGSVVCSYGFTGEPDAITIWDRFSGDPIQTIKLKTAASWMIEKGDRLFVRCYNTDEVFRIVVRD